MTTPTSKTSGRTPTEANGYRYLLWRYPVIGLALLVSGGVVFALLALNVLTNGPLVGWDQGVVQSLHTSATHDSAFMVGVMRFLGQLGHTYAIYLSIGLLVVTLLLRRWAAFLMALIGVIGGNVWFQVLTGLVARPRPTFSDPLETVAGAGFPSGHAIRMVLLFGLILYWLLPNLKTAVWRWMAAACTVGLILVVGYSRVYLGSHYPTDILGGTAFGLAWGGMVYTGVELAALWWAKRQHVTRSQMPDAGGSSVISG